MPWPYRNGRTVRHPLGRHVTSHDAPLRPHRNRSPETNARGRGRCHIIHRRRAPSRSSRSGRIRLAHRAESWPSHLARITPAVMHRRHVERREKLASQIRVICHAGATLDYSGGRLVGRVAIAESCARTKSSGTFAMTPAKSVARAVGSPASFAASGTNQKSGTPEVCPRS